MTDTVGAVDTIHIIDGKSVDPTIDKDPAHWEVTQDPPPDAHLVFFTNRDIGYASYDPPKGFTAEDIMKFKGSADAGLTLEKARKVIKRRNELGSLDLKGDARY